MPRLAASDVLAALALGLVACAPRTARVPDWGAARAKAGWSGALRAVAAECGTAGAPEDICPPGVWEAREQVQKAREDAYASFLRAHPLQIELIVLDRAELTALSGMSMPDDIDDHAMVVAARVRPSSPPPDVAWRVVDVSKLDCAAASRFQRPSEPEDFVVSCGGAARPSTLRALRRAEAFADVEAYRAATYSHPLEAEERYAVPFPRATRSTSSTAPRESVTAGALRSNVVVGAALLPVTLLADAMGAFGPARSSSREYDAWSRAVERERNAENVVWSRDPRVAASLRLWSGAWPAANVATTGYEVHLRDPLMKPFLATSAVFVEIAPEVSGTVLPAIQVKLEVPRTGDLRADVEGFGRAGPYTVAPGVAGDLSPPLVRYSPKWR